MTSGPGRGEEWPGYLAGFHTARAGATEAVLDRCLTAAGVSPHDWLAAGVATTGGLVVDVGCGSSPLASRYDRWVGVDVSHGELAVAAARGRGPLIEGRGEAMPLATSSADIVVAAMSLMVVADPVGVIREATRVLRPRGHLGVLLPASGPLTGWDRFRYGAMFGALGRSSLPFPHPRVGTSLGSLLAAAGLEVVSDTSVRFCYQLHEPDARDLFVASLYLPGVSVARQRAARAVARRWGGRELGVPFRRVVAHLAG